MSEINKLFNGSVVCFVAQVKMSAFNVVHNAVWSHNYDL